MNVSIYMDTWGESEEERQTMRIGPIGADLLRAGNQMRSESDQYSACNLC
jgi:hypothetical protein